MRYPFCKISSDDLRYDLTPAEIRQRQAEIRSQVIRTDRFGKIASVAGADLSMAEDHGFAAVILYSFPKLEEIERVWCEGEIQFSYIPGFLAFREIPLLLQAFAKLRHRPDLIMADGQGWAHPKRVGLACHLGVILNIPTIGCAKSILVGKYKLPGLEKASTSPLMDGKEVIGQVLRTRLNVRPNFVSCGHRVSLATAVRLTLQCCDGYRIPKPLRQADRWVKQLRILHTSVHNS